MICLYVGVGIETTTFLAWNLRPSSVVTIAPERPWKIRLTGASRITEPGTIVSASFLENDWVPGSQSAHE